MKLPESTLVGLETGTRERSAAWGRRVVLAAMTAMVLAGAGGLLGVRSATSSATDGTWHLSVEHATVARAGLDVPWQATVQHSGGFGKTLTLAVTGDYLDIYETQGFHPDPSSSTRDGDTLYLLNAYRGLAIVDLATFTLRSRLALGGVPHEMHVRGSRAFVFLSGADGVEI